MNQLVFNLAFLSAKPTGLSTYARNLLPHLTPFHPLLFTPQDLEGFHCQTVSTALSADRGTKGHLSRLLWYQTQLPRLLKRVEQPFLFSPIPEAPLFCPCPFVVTVHDLIPLRISKPFSRLTAYFRYYIPLVLHQAQHLICDSEATCRDVVDFYGISSRKLTPIALSYDAAHFRPQGFSTANYLLCLTRHDLHKNLPRVIQAYASLKTDAELWIAGPATVYTPGLQTLVQELALQERVKFLDYVPYAELPRLLEQALALVFPSLWEGFGLPVLEAMACGTPVITSNLASLPEVAGDAALLVDPYDSGAIAQAMQAILTQPQLRAQLRQAGLERVTHFSWSKTGAETAAVLNQFL